MIHDHEVERHLGVEAAGLRAQVRDREARRVVDVDRGFGQQPERMPELAALGVGKLPERSRVVSMPDSVESSRAASCDLDISRLKIALAALNLIAAFAAIPKARDVLPMLGLAARMIKSERWKPPAVILSRSANPLGTP